MWPGPQSIGHWALGTHLVPVMSSPSSLLLPGNRRRPSAVVAAIRMNSPSSLLFFLISFQFTV